MEWEGGNGKEGRRGEKGGEEKENLDFNITEVTSLECRVQRGQVSTHQLSITADRFHCTLYVCMV